MIDPLELARADDVPALVALRAAVAAQLRAQHGDGPWCRASSERGVLLDLRKTELFVARRKREVIATLSLTTRKPWAIDLRYFPPAQRPLYLHALAVAPDLQHRGIGAACMRQAVDLARARSADALRLDAYDAPAGAGPFYAKCGFTAVGRASYRGCPLIYFELRL